MPNTPHHDDDGELVLDPDSLPTHTDTDPDKAADYALTVWTALRDAGIDNPPTDN